jgi:hypothetical protein
MRSPTLKEPTGTGVMLVVGTTKGDLPISFQNDKRGRSVTAGEARAVVRSGAVQTEGEDVGAAEADFTRSSKA